MRIAGNPDKALLQIALHSLEKAEKSYCEVHNKKIHLLEQYQYDAVIIPKAKKFALQTIRFFNELQVEIEKTGGKI